MNTATLQLPATSAAHFPPLEQASHPTAPTDPATYYPNRQLQYLDSLQAADGFEQMSFLPEPDFYPAYPNPNTLPARCLSLMLNGQTFTHPEFEQITGSWRLSAVIFKLKELGWPVESHDLSAPTPECPNRTISRYYLPQEVIRILVT